VGSYAAFTRFWGREVRGVKTQISSWGKVGNGGSCREHMGAQCSRKLPTLRRGTQWINSERFNGDRRSRNVSKRATAVDHTIAVVGSWGSVDCKKVLFTRHRRGRKSGGGHTPCAPEEPALNKRKVSCIGGGVRKKSGRG